MFHESLVRLEVPMAWGARLAGPFAMIMPPAVGIDMAPHFGVLLVLMEGTAHPLLSYLYLGCPASKEAVDDRCRVGLSLHK